MTTVDAHAREALRPVRNAPGLLTMTRIGFVAKGVVYLLVGILALLHASGQGGDTTDQRGVLQRLSGQPFGEFALIVMATGLSAYALWRFLCAFANAEGESHDAKGWIKRVGHLSKGIAYAGIAWSAARLASGSGIERGDKAQSFASKMMNAPAGDWLIMIAGIVAVTIGAFQIRNGLKEKFMRHLRSEQMSSSEREWAKRAGKTGYIARGAVFGVIGAGFLLAGIHSDPSEAKGIERALDSLAQIPLLLAFVAVGLALYGIYCFVEARYRVLRT